MDMPVVSGNFSFTQLACEGAVLVECKRYGDDRGWFSETYKRPNFIEGGIEAEFVQDNESCSTKGVLRGLHFQISHPQAKLVRCVRGEVFDVGVDLRPDSPTFGRWVGEVLSEENRRQLFLPRGFAHGFYVMSDIAVFSYKCDDVYHPDDEGGIAWDDSDIGIVWPEMTHKPNLSAKDTSARSFSEFCAARGL